MNAISLREELAKSINNYGIILVTQDILEKAFPRPPFQDFLLTIALVGNGHRPATTQREQIIRFCKENDISETWYKPDEDVHVFRKSNWREIRGRQ